MKRYIFTAEWNEDQRETMAVMKEREDGNWIKYDDYEKEKSGNLGETRNAVLGEVRYMQCPFCKEDNFDMVGLLSHIKKDECKMCNSIEELIKIFS